MRSSKQFAPTQRGSAMALIDAVVIPGARQNRVERLVAGAWQIRVSEPPREGRANRAVAALLAKHLRIPKSRVNVTGGHRSKRKVISIEGLTVDEVQKILIAAAAE